MALTDAQKNLVENSHHVIFAVSKAKRVPISEIYDIGALALCHAAQVFQGNPADFFTYAYSSVWNAYLKERRKTKREIPVETIWQGCADRDFERAEARAELEFLAKQAEPYFSEREKEALRQELAGRESKDREAIKRVIRKLRKVSRGQSLRKKEKYDAQARTLAIQLRSMGYSFEEIQRRTGILASTAKTYYIKAGRPFRGTSADVARLLNVDRSTVLRHAKEAVKIGQYWKIVKIPVIRKTAPKSQKCYTEEELALLKSGLPDSIVAERLGRTENAVHIKRWRMKKQ